MENLQNQFIPSTLIRDLSFCVVDLETTGGKASFNRIIEVAVFRFQDGLITDKFCTLVNPGRPIPPWITLLTGIDDDMVKRAPAFADIAERLQSLLLTGVFVAHNAPFDYGFLQEEFNRLGRAFDRPRLCTVKMARQLLPELPSRSLGHLCDHLLIDIYDRHRAYGDAEATVYVLKHFLKTLERREGISTWGDLDAFLEAGPLALPKSISFSTFCKLPADPGRYLLKDAAGQLIATGKTTNIRRRIKSFFARSNQSEKSQRLRDVVASIEFAVSCQPSAISPKIN